jgi:predicted porin
MKKTLLAMAVLAASGAAFAQSSVTLYGRADVGLTKITGTSVALADGGDIGTASRIGLRGTEDLGGGLKASFLVEARYNVDANVGATTFGSRNSYVDLSGGFGTVRLGRHLNPALLLAATHGGAWGTDYGQASNSNILSIEGARYNNALSYMTPAGLGGFSAMLTTALKESNTYSVGSLTGEGAVGATKIPVSALFAYSGGPVLAHVSLTKNGRAGTKLLAQAGVTYDAGVVKASLAVEQDANQVGGKNAYQLGVTAPLGAAKLQFTYGKDQKGSAADLSQLAFGGQYDLSKRTNVYGYVAQLKPAGSSAKNQVTLGVQHSF